MNHLFAQMLAGYSLLHLLILAIVVVAIVAVAVAASRGMGVAIPGWVMQIMWILLAAFLAIVAIRFLVGLL